VNHAKNRTHVLVRLIRRVDFEYWRLTPLEARLVHAVKAAPEPRDAFKFCQMAEEKSGTTMKRERIRQILVKALRKHVIGFTPGAQ
jgi:hypothetical protein